MSKTHYRYTSQFDTNGSSFAVTWDPATTTVILSNGNLTATGPGGYVGSTVPTPIQVGLKWYWETTIGVTGNNDDRHGVGATEESAGGILGTSANSVGWRKSFSQIYRNGVGIFSTPSDYGTGDVLMWAYDPGTGSLWVGRNGTWFNSGDPAAGTGFITTGLVGTIVPAIYRAQAGHDTTANFGASAFVYTVPTGFETPATIYTIEEDPTTFKTITPGLKVISGANATKDTPASPFDFSETTWNPADTGTNITLSNGDLTATKSGASTYTEAWSRVHAVTPLQNNRKYYWETVGVSGGGGSGYTIGFAKTSVTLNGYLGSIADTVGWNNSPGQVWANGGGVIHTQSWSNGDILGFALDPATGNFWLSVNGVWTNSGDPSTGANPFNAGFTGTDIVPATVLFSNGNAHTINTGNTTFAYPVPTGFNEPSTNFANVAFTGYVRFSDITDGKARIAIGCDSDGVGYAIDFDMSATEWKIRYNPILSFSQTSGYKNLVLADGAVGYWRLGETSGTQATDELGTNHGTYTNTPTLGSNGVLSGDTDTSVTFTAANSEYVTMGDVLDFERTDPFSLECWFKINTPGLTDRLIAKINFSSPFEGYQIVNHASGYMRFDLINGSGNNITVITVATGFDDGEWHHVVLTYDGSSSAAGVNIYVDGVDEPLTITADTLSATTLTTNALTIISMNGAGSYSDTTVDEAAIYDIELTQPQAEHHYNVGTTEIVKDLKTRAFELANDAWYPFKIIIANDILKVFFNGIMCIETSAYAPNGNWWALSGIDTGTDVFFSDVYYFESQVFFGNVNVNGVPDADGRAVLFNQDTPKMLQNGFSNVNGDYAILIEDDPASGNKYFLLGYVDDRHDVQPRGIGNITL